MLRSFFLGFLLCAGAVFFSAATCTPTQQRTAYNTISSAEISTRAAFDAYLDQELRQTPPNLDNLKTAAQAFNSFQLAEQVAIAAANGNTNAPAPAALLLKRDAAVSTFISLKPKGKP